MWVHNPISHSVQQTKAKTFCTGTVLLRHLYTVPLLLWRITGYLPLLHRSGKEGFFQTLQEQLQIINVSGGMLELANIYRLHIYKLGPKPTEVKSWACLRPRQRSSRSQRQQHRVLTGQGKPAAQMAPSFHQSSPERCDQVFSHFSACQTGASWAR